AAAARRVVHFARLTRRREKAIGVRRVQVVDVGQRTLAKNCLRSAWKGTLSCSNVTGSPWSSLFHHRVSLGLKIFEEPSAGNDLSTVHSLLLIQQLSHL